MVWVRGAPVRFPSSQDIPAGSPIRFSLSRDSDTRVGRQMSSTSRTNRFDFGDCGPPQPSCLGPLSGPCVGVSRISHRGYPAYPSGDLLEYPSPLSLPPVHTHCFPPVPTARDPLIPRAGSLWPTPSGRIQKLAAFMVGSLSQAPLCRVLRTPIPLQYFEALRSGMK